MKEIETVIIILAAGVLVYWLWKRSKNVQVMRMLADGSVIVNPAYSTSSIRTTNSICSQLNNGLNPCGNRGVCGDTFDRFGNKLNFNLGDNIGSNCDGNNECSESLSTNMESVYNAGNTCPYGDVCIPHAGSGNNSKHGTCAFSKTPCAVVTKCFPQAYTSKLCQTGTLDNGEPWGYCERRNISCAINDRGMQFYN